MSGHTSSKVCLVYMNFAKKEVTILSDALCGGSQEDETQKRRQAMVREGETGEVDAKCWLPSERTDH